MHIKASSLNTEPTQQTLIQLKNAIESLKEHKNPEISKLCVWAHHIHPNMTEKHIFSLAVPFERALRKTVDDSAFLPRLITPHFAISDTDHTYKQGTVAPLQFILENWRSAFNVGALLRSAECLGAQHIHLCGYSPTPEQAKVNKTGLGSHEWISWSYTEKIQDIIQQLQDQKIWVVALETCAEAQSIYDPFPQQPVAFVLGNERFGLDTETLALCNECRVIPMQGKKNSLNASVAAAVAGFEWRRQYQLWSDKA